MKHLPDAVGDPSLPSLRSRAGSAQGDKDAGLKRGFHDWSSASYVDEWRAGRRVRMPVDLHRPSRYLDTGVPDGERALLLRGTTLVGSTKSG